MPQQDSAVEDIQDFAQNIVDTVREPLLMLDTTLRVQSANRAFYQTFHVSPEETENHLIYELGNGQWDIPKLRTLLEDVVPMSSVFNDFELEHTFPVIGRRVMLLNARKLLAGNHGELLVLAMEDVTERRRAEADLKAIGTYAQDIVDTVREPLLMLDTTLRVQSANRAFYQTFHVSPEETENHLIYELGNGQWDIPDLRTLLEDVVPKSSVFNDFELEHTFPVIGRRVMLLNARKLLAGNHGELLVLAMEDVTERRRAEEEVLKAAADLKAIETFSENIVDTVREPLLTLDSTLRVHSANRAFYHTFQVSPAETEDRLIYELGNGQWDIPALRTLLEDVVPKSSVFNDFELEHTFPVIGRRVMLLNARKLEAGNHGELLVLAMEDVTERRHAEEEVLKAAADLKAIETFSENIVDTVREPLLTLDSTLRVHSANRAFYQTFHVSANETEGRLIYELGNGQWDIPALRTLLEDVVPKSSVFNDFELEHTFPVIGRRVMLLNARKLEAGNHGELLVLAMEDVTERRHAEEEVLKAAADLKAIETFSENIVDTVREPLLTLDSTLRVHSANRAFYQTFHVDAEETKGRLIYELGNGQWDIPSLRTLLEDVVPKSSVFNDFELEHTFPVIGRRVMLLNARKLEAGSHAELLVLAMEDVTERRRAEADLKAIGTYAQDIVDTVREPLLMLDTTLRVQSANRAFYQTFHVSPDETEHHLIYELGNGQWDIPALRTLLEDVVPKSAVFNDFELEHTFPVIGRRVMLLNARKLEAGNHGELLVLAMEDVTERKRAAEQQRTASAYARSLIEASPDPLVTISPEGKITDANQATELVTGIARQHLIGTDFSDYFTEPEQARTGYQQVFSQGFVRDYPLAIRHVSGSVTDVLYNASLYRTEQGTVLGVFAAARDVTERKRVEEEVAKAREAAEAASRTKSLFLANMSHELRTPLNAILGYSEMLQEEASELELGEFTADLEKINVAGKHLLALINDILDLSKIEAGKMELFLESFDLGKMIEEVAATVHPLVEKNANSLHIKSVPDLGMMYGDQIKVRQALFNLLSNAVKFTREGNVILDTIRERMDGSDWILFRVTDTGIGLSSDQILKLFQAFTQADASTTRKFGGTGLGLALTRRFCQMMGGDVVVQSVPGKGSTFTIKLPAIVAEPKPETSGEAELPAPGRAADYDEPIPRSDNCVLVIDDGPSQRELMKRFLTKEGFCIRTAGSGEEGLRLARQLHPAAITLDVMMPDMDGWTVLEALKADPLLCDIPVIMLTMVDDRKRGFKLGAADYATKPVDRDLLSRILKKHTVATPPCLVLLVEDDADTRSMLRVILENEGCNVAEAENGSEALECMASEMPSLILLDLVMPVMDGYEFARRMRKHDEWRLIPIIVMTAYDLKSEDLLRLNGYVEKVLPTEGDSYEALLGQVRDMVLGYTAPLSALTAAIEAKTDAELSVEARGSVGE